VSALRGRSGGRGGKEGVVTQAVDQEVKNTERGPDGSAGIPLKSILAGEMRPGPVMNEGRLGAMSFTGLESRFRSRFPMMTKY